MPLAAQVKREVTTLGDRQAADDQLVRLRELPPLPPTGSDGQTYKRSYKKPTRKKK